MALLEVEDLHVSFRTREGVVRAVAGASFSVDRGRTLGIVGESGSGKTVSALTVMGMTRAETTEVGGRVLLDGVDLLQLPPHELERIRGPRIAMIFQDPLSSLHPLYRVGWQIAEAIRAHEPVSRREASKRAVEALRDVGVPSPEERVSSYPHELSGGMRQRVMIAMALVLDPDVLIADEPTTALDVTIQAQILELIAALQARRGTAVVLITHDLGAVAETAHDVAVMYAGRVVERGPLHAVLGTPEHPYTWGLLQSLPRLDGTGRRERLHPIDGQPPSLIHVPSGCPFHPRCPHRFEPCVDIEPPLLDSQPGHAVACHLPAAQRLRLGQAVRSAQVTRAVSRIA
jgi:peptide/nickel transport system ATP-binding protein